MQESEIFRVARGLPDAARYSYLAEACSGNAELQSDVEALLEVYHRQQGSTQHVSSRVAETQIVPPNVIFADRYRLLELIGQGGMGLVYLADQLEPIHRQVAIKIIRTKFATPSIISRFEQECQALAVMDHPNIAKVHDAGMARYAQEQLLLPEEQQASTPYLVMEYIQGSPITEYCEQKQLTIRERVALFISVCQAIQHAHLKGIIHRDLKPSNILVVNQDGKSVAKVIDFGIAKVVEQKITEQIIQTEVGLIIGTLEYMSPEQAQVKNKDVDTRSDIYSLGVILYELISGTLPLTREEFSKCGLPEALEIIQRKELIKPSSKLTGIQHKVTPDKLTEIRKARHEIQGDLDCIVMKCLEKERNHRYQTAMQLGQELERYLQHEPVQAGPPSWMYRFGKLYQRHRLTVSAAALIFLSLITGAVAAAVGMVQARNAERKAYQHALEAEKAKGQEVLLRQEVEKQRDKAQEEKRIAQSISGFLRNKLLLQHSYHRQVDALMASGESLAMAERDPRISSLLNVVEKEISPERLESNFPRQPSVQAALLHTVGFSYVSVGHVAKGVPLLQRALQVLPTAEHGTLNHFDYQNSLALAYAKIGKAREAIDIYQSIVHELQILNKTETQLIVQSNLASALDELGNFADSLSLKKQILEATRQLHGDGSITTLIRERGIADTLTKLARYREAIEIYQRLATMLKQVANYDHPEYLALRCNLGNCYLAHRQYQNAYSLLSENYVTTKEKLGTGHPLFLSTAHNLAACLRAMKRYDESLIHFKEIYAIKMRNLGDEHPSTIESLNFIGAVNRDLNKLDEAEDHITRASRLFEKILGEMHHDTLMSQSNLGSVYFAQRRFKEAEVLLEQVARKQEATIGIRHTLTLKTLQNLALLYSEAGKHRQALSLLEKIVPEFQKEYGSKHLETLRIQYLQGKCWNAVGRHTESVKLLTQVLADQIAGQEETLLICNSHNTLGLSHFNLKQFQQAIHHFSHASEGRSAMLGVDHSLSLTSKQNLANSYYAAGNKQEAYKLSKEARQRRMTVLGPIHAETLTSLLREVACLLDVGRPDEAVKLLESTHQLIVQQLGAADEKALQVASILGRSYWASKQHQQAIAIYELLFDHSTKKFGANHATTLMARANLGINLKDDGQYDKALAHLQAVYQAGEHYQTGFVACGLVDLHLKQHNNTSALELFQTIHGQILRKSMAGTSRALIEWTDLAAVMILGEAYEHGIQAIDAALETWKKSNHDMQGKILSNTGRARLYSMKGTCLIGLERFEDAEKYLLLAHDTFPKVDPNNRSPQGRDWQEENSKELVRLYEKINKPLEAKKWIEAIQTTTKTRDLGTTR